MEKTLDERIIDLEFELAKLKSLKEEQDFILTLSQKIELARKIINNEPSETLRLMGYKVDAVERMSMKKFLKYARQNTIKEGDNVEDYWYIAKGDKIVYMSAEEDLEEMALELLKEKSLEVIENEMKVTGWSLYSLYEEYKGY